MLNRFEIGQLIKEFEEIHNSKQTSPKLKVDASNVMVALKTFHHTLLEQDLHKYGN